MKRTTLRAAAFAASPVLTGFRRIISSTETKARERLPVDESTARNLEAWCRGGERFLSVTAPKASSVLDVWLLREGDAVGAWHLLAIEARAAVFRVDGQTQRLALP